MFYTLSLSSPLPARAALDQVTLQSEIASIQLSTTLPGGFAGCTIALIDAPSGTVPYLVRPAAIRPFGHVEVHAGGALLFAGRIVQTDRPGGVVTSIVCEGYGLSALTDGFASSTETTPQTSGTILAKLLPTQAPLLTLGNGDQFVDPGTLHAPTDFNNMDIKSVLQQMITDGGNINVVWDYYVYDNQVLCFLPRRAPDAPRYVVPFDDTVDWSEDYRNMYGSVTVSYQDTVTNTSTSTPTNTNTTFADRWGVSRSKQIQGATLSESAALNYRDTFLVQNASPTVKARIVRQAGEMMKALGGSGIPAYLARAGEWVQIGDQAPLCIVQTSFDTSNEQMTIELGSPSPGFPQFIAQMSQTVAALANGYSAYTGGKLPTTT